MQYDLKALIAVLTWATGHKENGKPLIQKNPWGPDVRKAQKWELLTEANRRNPTMTPELRNGLLEHSPSWQFSAALRLQRLTARRNSSIRQLRWSDINFEAGVVVWREETDKAGRRGTTPLTPEVESLLRSLPSRGVGETPVFPSAEDPSEPAPFYTFQTWLRRARRRWLDAVEDDAERSQLKDALYGLGFHAEKRAAVRDPKFRSLSPKAQEKLSGTNYLTLKDVYDDMSDEDLREEMRQVGLAS